MALIWHNCVHARCLMVMKVSLVPGPLNMLAAPGLRALAGMHDAFTVLKFKCN